MGERFRYYRIFFNLFSLATIIPLLIYSHSARWGIEPLFSWRGTLCIVKYGLIGLAVILILGVGSTLPILSSCQSRCERKQTLHRAIAQVLENPFI